MLSIEKKLDMLSSWHKNYAIELQELKHELNSRSVSEELQGMIDVELDVMQKLSKSLQDKVELVYECISYVDINQ